MNLKFFGAMIFVLFLLGNENNAKSVFSSNDSTRLIRNDDFEKLELNNGKKWKIVKPMFKYLKTINDEIKKFDNSTKKDYNAIGKVLSTNIDSLLSNCSMKGKAHDELHKWLIPFVELVKENESKESRQIEKFVEIKNAMKEFNIYFESE